MRRIIYLIIFSLIMSSCSPMMHVTGFGMRKFNTSQNKYSKKNPYFKK